MTKDTTTPAPSEPVAGPVQRPVRPLAEKCRDMAAQAGHYGAWSGGVLLEQAADELDRLTEALKQANDQAEHFERLWYLTNEDAARYHFAKTMEGQVVTMETFKTRGAAELDQALDDAMEEAADAQNERGYAA